MNLATQAQTHAAPRTQAPDFWEGGVTGTQPDSEFSDMAAISPPKSRGGSAAVFLLATCLSLAVGWFCFEMFVNERDPLATLTGYWDMVIGSGEDPGDTMTRAAPVKAAKSETATSQPPVTEPVVSAAVAGNPYWMLPNKILGGRAPMKRQWAPEEEETLRAGLAHHFAYQRLKTVMEVRARRLLGSDAVLWDAMQDKKYWTRMFAAIGLAEFNVEISLQSLEAAMAGARSELVADFFERFVQSPKPAELFIMRQVVRLLDEKGRLVVLRAIGNSHDALRDLYLVAATLDPAPRIQAVASAFLARLAVDERRRNELSAIVNGTEDGDYLLTGTSAPKSRPAPALPLVPPATEPDVEAQLKQFQTSGGDVEFYDGESVYEDETTSVSDEGDSDTFEYEE